MGSWFAEKSSVTTGMLENVAFSSKSLVGRKYGVKMNRLNRIGAIIGILEGQQCVSSVSCPFCAARLL